MDEVSTRRGGGGGGGGLIASWQNYEENSVG